MCLSYQSLPGCKQVYICKQINSSISLVLQQCFKRSTFTYNMMFTNTHIHVHVLLSLLWEYHVCLRFHFNFLCDEKQLSSSPEHKVLRVSYCDRPFLLFWIPCPVYICLVIHALQTHFLFCCFWGKETLKCPWLKVKPPCYFILGGAIGWAAPDGT